MVYICNKCDARYDTQVLMCEKCEGFGIIAVTDEELRQLFRDQVEVTCTKCGMRESRTVSMVYTRAAKTVFVGGTACSIALAALFFVVWVFLLHNDRIPLVGLYAPAAVLFAISSAIATRMRKRMAFHCTQCGSYNVTPQ